MTSTTAITPAVLLAIAPHASADLLGDTAQAMTQLCPISDIATPLRLAHFIGQMAHESSGFGTLEENLNYSATGLMRTWPHRFSRIELANRYAHQPEKIAEFVYGGRADLGNIEPGDGWKYRGRGYIQLTGRDNYIKAGIAVRQNLELKPELMLRPSIALDASIHFWMGKGLNQAADADDIERITHAINGGLNGLASRGLYVERAKKAFGI